MAGQPSEPRPPVTARFLAATLGWIPRTCRAALALTGEQRQTLMSWGLLLGVIALTAFKLWSLRVIEGHWQATTPSPLVAQLVDGLFAQLERDTWLQAALVLGVVAIARGGSMTISVTKGGATVDFQASGQAAKQLATDTGLADAMASPAPPAGLTEEYQSNG